MTGGSVDAGSCNIHFAACCMMAVVCMRTSWRRWRKASSHSNTRIDFSLITYGLKAQREQAITIDVAYRYFSTQKRKFIIADTPAHEQYTRNMITGASTADVAVLLLARSQGASTACHAYLLWLLGCHIVLLVNKMDLASFEQAPFEIHSQQQFCEFTAFMSKVETALIPVGALAGDNVVQRSTRMPWYTGPALLSGWNR